MFVGQVFVGQGFSPDKKVWLRWALAPEASESEGPGLHNPLCRIYPSFVRARRSDPQIKFLFLAVPGRAQPATVGLPASGPVQILERDRANAREGFA